MSLRRTPTSTGNRLKGTWSFWVKRNNLNGSSTSRYLFYANNGGSQANAVRFNDDDGGDSLRALFWNGTDNNAFINFDKLRDPSSWQHYLIVYDSTLSTFDNMSNNDQTLERIKIFVNGRRMIETGGNSTQNKGIVNANQLMTTWGNAGSINALFATDTNANGALITTFDAFFVDGQALTPDVFGFYKEGKGYVSAGSTQSTDFRPGQWVPKAPRTIKSEINRKGGFGVNGFYLPMNDSSNFGADFHTTPNSIITLKGEDLPQPRNGAPDTTDAYVSQLRTDPYAANLVLAVPGIKLENTNTELVTNGNFSNGTTDWTALDDGTLSATGGILKVTSTNGTNLGVANQVVTTVIGTRYTFSVDVIPGNTTGRLRVDDSVYYQGDYLNKSNSDYGTHTISFEATSTTTHISLSPNSPTNGDHCFFTNVSLKEEIPVRDYSADIKGSGTNKTLTANGNAGVGYEIPSYYGSALSFDGTGDYLSVADNSDFGFGTGDFTIEYWIYHDGSSSSAHTFDLRPSGNEDSVTAFYASSTELRIYLNAADKITIAGELVGNQWTHHAIERNGSTLTFYQNGVARGVNTSSGDTLRSSAPAVIGAKRDFSASLNGYLQDFRVYKGVAKYKGGFDVPKPYTPVGIGTWRAVPDTTANNFATLNPLIGAGTAAGDTVPALLSGNLYLDNANQTWAPANIGVSTGKWYAEFMCLNGSFGSNIGVSGDALHGKNNQGSFNAAGVSYVRLAGSSLTKQYNSTSAVAGSLGYSSGDIVSVTIDVPNREFKFYKNNTLIFTDTSASSYSPLDTNYYFTPFRTNDGANPIGSDWSDVAANFGQNPTFSGNTTAGTYTDSNGKGLFKYEPPSGFLALCEDNLPTPAIADPGDYFKTVLWTGDGNSGRSITGVGFKPDFVWIGNRDRNTYKPVYDSIRGATYMLRSNETNAEASFSTVLNSFDSDGFTVGTDSAHNGSGEGIVAWCWKAGGTTVSNTDGGVTSQVSVNQSAGFSIIKVDSLPASTTSTFGHGLNKKPDFIIFKSRNNATNWDVYHSSLTPDGERKLYLNSSNAEIDSGFMSDTPPTSSVISFNPGSSNSNHIVYCWTEIENFSKFGSYIGNNSDDGPMVYCGFKPAWVLIKRTTTNGYYWTIYDNARKPTNPVNHTMTPDQTNLEVTNGGNGQIDFLSNGFKCRNTDGGINASGVKYIFAAFAESPFQTANAK